MKHLINMNNYLYLLLNLASVSIPLLYSVFEKEFHFIKHFKKALISIIALAIPFLIWDFWFTHKAIWGFNSNYHLSVLLLGMPVEEWLFFFCIPYSCLFTHQAFKYYLPNFKLPKKITVVISILLILSTSIILIFNADKCYTLINFTYYILLMVFSLKYCLKTLREFYPSFLVILIPFFAINGVLTGSFIDFPIVWYNNSENIGFRIFTIPFEDVFYAFNLLFSIQLVFNFLNSDKKYQKHI
ncbi:MAG: lycopene cyclase domain-containing protein [Tenacibaculum sp.]